MRAKGLKAAGLLTLLLALSSCVWFQQPTLSIALTPAAGAVNTVVAITGTGFGASQGTSVVTLDGIQAQVLAWGDTAITARVPVLPTPAGERAIVVGVVRGGVAVATGLFTLQRGVLFETNRDGNSEIYMMNPDGSNPVNLSNHPDSDASAAWSPDGTRIAFVSRRDGDSEIYVMSADGSGFANLTHHPDSDYFPVWSPDGEHIAFQSDRESTGPVLSIEPKISLSGFNLEIFVMNVDGTGQTNVSNDSAWDAYPSWSPDGDRIVFESDRDEEGPVILVLDGLGHEIYVVDADGDHLANLSNSPEDDGRPRWSPAGGKIVFESYRDGNREIYTMNPDGTGQMRLTNNPGGDSYPSWSPDGDWITFHSDRDGNSEIYKMTKDGLAVTRLTTSPEWDWGPSWSPDGADIVFQSSRDGNVEVYRMAASGAFQERLTDESGWDAHPVWGTPAWVPPL